MAISSHAACMSSFAPLTTDMGEENWIDVDGIRTRYFDQGAGERIVFIHGVHMGATDGSSSARTWDLNFSVLAQTFNVISLDRLGQGYTDNPKSDEDYTMHASVQHVIALLDTLGKKPYHLVGHSRGGYIVTRITMERPDLVKTSTCVSSGTLAPGATRTDVATRNRPQPEGDRESIRWYLERYSYNPMIVTDRWLDDSHAIASLEKTRRASSRMRGAGLLKSQFAPQLFAQRAQTHRWLVEEGMPCPTLVVWGRNDPGAHLEAGIRLIEMFMKHQPQTEWRLFNRCGHFVFREHPAGFNRLLSDFVRAHS
jgi:2-hydroxy-6-oxonona-2,4-dienedioate hydrolase